MSTASEAWFKCIDPESKWGKFTLEGAMQKNDDDNNAVEVDARRTLASIFESFGNDSEFLVSVPVPHNKSEQEATLHKELVLAQES
ncbi:hypothetical protein L211DRAFT_351195 [Terfezia boudieri ATCC MYA-4762]|uniref:Uncharacterized protein n=1 Tax=Terfezia boudieri ATCC MYA-4762 TaxID=1051890 RepID=A0A3N4LGY1_9PEZI|nr:hypothetical protein L211DRAFT_351195 [Terfezia boudieri ATCC MYA-4762]